MDFFTVIKELALVLLIVAISLMILVIVLFVFTRLLRRRLKKQRMEINSMQETCDRLSLEIVTLRGEIEAVRAIRATGELPVISEASDCDPDDAPLFLDEVLDPQIFEPTADKSTIEARRPVQSVSVTEYDTGKDVARYTVKHDAKKNDWVIRREGQARAVRRFPTKEEAIQAAKELARKKLN